MVSTFDTVDQERWIHALARSVGGALYASQGVYSSSTCPDSARNGTIRRIDASSAAGLTVWGFRNPMYMRCHYADEVCIASELGDDGGASFGAHGSSWPCSRLPTGAFPVVRRRIRLRP